MMKTIFLESSIFFNPEANKQARDNSSKALELVLEVPNKLEERGFKEVEEPPEEETEEPNPPEIVGLRRSGKSYLLTNIYKQYLLSSVVKETQIIIVSLDNNYNALIKVPNSF